MDKIFIDAYLKVIKEDSDGYLDADDEPKWTDKTHFEAKVSKTFDNQGYDGHLYCSFYGELKTADDGSSVIAWESEVHSDAMDEDLDIELKITKYSGIQIFVSYEIKEHNSQELRIKATSRSCFIKDNKVISLKRECPEYDLKLKELEERQ